MRGIVFGVAMAVASTFALGASAQSWPDSWGDSWGDSFGDSWPDSFGDSGPFRPWQGWREYYSHDHMPMDGFYYRGFALSEGWIDSWGGPGALVASRVQLTYGLTIDGTTRAGFGTYLEGEVNPWGQRFDVMPFAYIKASGQKLTAGYAENAIDHIAPTFPWSAGADGSFSFVYNPLLRYDGRFGNFRVSTSYSLDEWLSGAASYKTGPFKFYGGFDTEIPTGYFWGEVGGTYRFNDMLKAFGRAGTDGTASEVELGLKYFFNNRILLTGDVLRFDNPGGGGFDVSAGLRYGLLRNTILYAEYQGNYPDLGAAGHTMLGGVKISF